MLLADSANVSREGKLNVLGIFDTIYAREFPTTHAQMQLVIRFEAPPAEAGTTRQVEVQLAREGGEVLFALPGAMKVMQREPGEPVRLDHMLTLNNVTFDGPGRYVFRVAVDGAVQALVPLRVEQISGPH